MRLTACLFFLLACFFVPICSAQDVYNEINVGTPPNGLFHGGEIDTVQTNNGNLHVEIPLWTVKGRGPLAPGALFVLDTKEWAVKFTTQKDTGLVIATILPEVNGTLGGIVSPLATLTTSQTVHAGTPTCYFQVGGYTSNYVIREPNGTKHHLVPDPGGTCPPVQHYNAYYADDGSGFVFIYNTGVFRKDGTGSNISGLRMDSNGNQLPSSQDTLGRALTDGTLTYYDNSGNPQTIQLTTTSVTTNTHLCQWYAGQYDTCNESTGSRNEVSQITLPNGMTYTINYVQNDMGEPSSITLPSGAQVSWTYNSGDKGGPVVATRTVTANGQASTWTYNYGGTTGCPAPFSTCVNSIVDPLGNETDLTYTLFQAYATNFGPSLPLVTTKQIKDKSSGSLMVIKTDQTDYSTSVGPALPTRVTTTWNQPNLVSKVETDYDSFTFTNTAGLTFSASNPVAKREYDWATGAPGRLLRRTTLTYLHLSNSTYLNANILDRVTSKQVYDSLNNTCDGQATVCAQTLYSYDSTTITSTSGAPNHDYTGHGPTFTTRGNPTQVQRWSSSTSSYLTTTSTFDDLGNLRSTTDPNNNVTSYSYTDNFTDGVNRNAQAFVTQVTHPVTNGVNHIEKKQFFWYTSLVAASCGQNFSAACNNTYSPPQPDYVTLTYDKMFRPLTINRGDGGTTTGSYNDTTLPLSVTASSSITSSLSKAMTGVFDDLYRIKQTQLTSEQQGTVFTDTTYDALGRKSTVTNPHRSGSSPTDGTTTFFYDAFNRSCLLVPPDGTLPTPGTSCPSTRPTGDVLTVYSGNTTTVTDEAGKSRKSVTDGLGHLTQVFEDPVGLNYETDYAYDALDNLLSVNQKGGDPNSANWRTRTFAYDSLSRLLCAANPEISIATCPTPDNGSYTNGTARYTYDNDGNVLTKKSPKPNQTSASVTVTATFGYDALNRLTSKSFDNGDPTINYAYDGVVPSGWPTACNPGNFSFGNGIGKRTAMCDAAGMELWGYSITSGIGWMTTDQRTTTSVTKTAAYQNNFAGSLATLTYPSTRVITYTPDGANRISKAVDVPNSINYVTGTCANGTDTFGVCYTPPGSPSSFLNGPTLASTFYYNSRLQPCRISAKSSGTAPGSCTDTNNIGNVLDFSYCFYPLANNSCPTTPQDGNNGNVMGITNNRDTTRSQVFTYDSLNRIAVAETTSTYSTSPPHCWGEAYFYDNLTTAGGGWGNLTKIASPSSAYTGCTGENLNVTALNNNQLSGFNYDTAGNLLNDGASNYVYDGENRITTGAGVTYTYDGDGKRVRKSSGKLYWYGLGGDALDETDLSGNTNNSSFSEYIFFGRERVARRDYQNNVNYYFSDHLGTARIVANSSGTVLDDSDFYPYGGERVITSSSGNRYKFTGKERDSESGLDNFGARYNSSSLGRFISADPVSIKKTRLLDPQRLNLYTYVRNSPLTLVDPNGQDLQLWIVVKDQSSRSNMTQAATKIAGDFHRWGVKQVNVHLTSDASKVQTGKNTIIVNAEKNESMTKSATFGEHFPLSNKVTVNTELANTNSQSLRNVTDHEVVHEAQPFWQNNGVSSLLGLDHSSDKNDLMYKQYDPLKQGDPQLSQGEQKMLQDRFNQPTDKDQATVDDALHEDPHKKHQEGCAGLPAGCPAPAQPK